MELREKKKGRKGKGGERLRSEGPSDKLLCAVCAVVGGAVKRVV
jgi:hypothetical protein